MASSDAPPHFSRVHCSIKSREGLRVGGIAASPATSAAGLAPRSGRTNKSERGPLVGERHGKINKP